MSYHTVLEFLKSNKQDDCSKVSAKKKHQKYDLALSLPHSMVHPLPQQLNGRLGSILLSCWHVHVIDKDDAFLSHGRAKHALPPLVQL